MDDDAVVVVNDDSGSLTQQGPGVVSEGGRILLAVAAADDEDCRLIDPNSKGPEALMNFRGVLSVDADNMDPLVVTAVVSESTSWLLVGVGNITCCDAEAEAKVAVAVAVAACTILPVFLLVVVTGTKTFAGFAAMNFVVVCGVVVVVVAEVAVAGGALEFVAVLWCQTCRVSLGLVVSLTLGRSVRG